jgi:hypothetical protein
MPFEIVITVLSLLLLDVELECESLLQHHSLFIGSIISIVVGTINDKMAFI